MRSRATYFTGSKYCTCESHLLQAVHRLITRHLLSQVELKLDYADSGAVKLIQRFGSEANLDIHLNHLALEAVSRRVPAWRRRHAEVR